MRHDSITAAAWQSLPRAGTCHVFTAIARGSVINAMFSVVEGAIVNAGGRNMTMRQ
jgi:hypothetical protein